MAATIAGNTVGVDNRAFVIAVKVFGKSGSGPVSDIIKGIEWGEYKNLEKSLSSSSERLTIHVSTKRFKTQRI